MGLITETNQQYYEGTQFFIASTTAPNQEFTTSFNTDLVFYKYDPNDTDYALNNFKLYTSADGMPGSFVEYTSAYTVDENKITITASIAAGSYIVVQLKKNTGGNYGNNDAYGNTVEDNYDSYSHVKLSEVINNFQVAYVGTGKLIPSAKRTDIIFHAKRGLQELSYDTLRTVKSQELTIPNSLSVIIPQDYVNYTKISWIDSLGIKRPIYPANNLTISPKSTPIQDENGEPIQDNFSNNIEGSSITEERWDNSKLNLINTSIDMEYWPYYAGMIDGGVRRGQLYGLDPQHAQVNGWFDINPRENKISFSSDLVNKLIVLEYISDGLAYDMDTKIPKLAEEALYAHISHAIIASRVNQPEYVVRRLKQERSAKIRNAKIRLSNIKLEEITQVMRGKSKWIKH